MITEYSIAGNVCGTCNCILRFMLKNEFYEFSISNEDGFAWFDGVGIQRGWMDILEVKTYQEESNSV